MQNIPETHTERSGHWSHATCLVGPRNGLRGQKPTIDKSKTKTSAARSKSRSRSRVRTFVSTPKNLLIIVLVKLSTVS